MKRILCIAIFLILTTMAFSAEKVTILYLDRSETNLEAGSFIKSEAKQQKQDLSVKYAAGFNKLKGNEQIIIMLNSGLSEGIDPRIESFIASSDNKDSLILVNLYSRGNEIFVEATDELDSLYGVDEISAASQYKKSTPVKTMHKQWATKVFELIREKL